MAVHATTTPQREAETDFTVNGCHAPAQCGMDYLEMAHAIAGALAPAFSDQNGPGDLLTGRCLDAIETLIHHGMRLQMQQIDELRGIGRAAA